MKIKKILSLLIVPLLFLSSCGTKEIETDTTLTNNDNTTMSTFENGDIVAVMKTTNGTIQIKLHTKEVPKTTTNFIALSKKGYYNDVIFNRIIKGFMIQWGDPDGTGMGGESIYGEKFDDEFHPDLKNIKYSLSMANAGPNTNGSQFFINGVDNNFLDNKHSVFGQVIEGTENVDKIIKVKTGANDKPEKDVKIISIDIKEYQNGTLKDYEFDLDETLKKTEEENLAKQEAKKTKEIESWDTVSVHYTGTFPDGEKFDSSLDRGQPIEFKVGAGQMIPGFDAGVVWLKIGDKKSLTLEPKDAYGEYDEKKTQTLPKEQLTSFTDAGIVLEKGSELPTAQGTFKIIDTTETEVVIDVNHPLSGKTLLFDIEVVDIK